MTDAAPGELTELVVESRAMQRDCPVTAVSAGSVPPRRVVSVAGGA